MTLTMKELKMLLRKAWSQETTADPQGWTPDNPAWGQCAVTALVVQDFLGGELVRGDAKMGNILASHYWNKLLNGKDLDLTREQFPKGTEVTMLMIRERNYLLSYPETRKRYSALRLNVEKLIQPNPLFSDRIYQLCFETALKSKCQKMKFGCVVLYKDLTIVAQTTNEFIKPLQYLCEPECIRLKIQSRTESMIGACGHAEEWALQELRKKNVLPADCSLYEAGFDAKTSKPWLREEVKDFTCLRCAVQLHMAGIGEIKIAHRDHWESLTAEEAVEKSVAYTLKEKKI